MKNVSKIAKQILCAQGLEKKFKEGIEDYTGKKVKNLEYVEDPQVPTTYAIRTNKTDTWLVVHYNPSWSTEKLSGELEEAEFTTWPPVSGDLKFFVW